MDKSKNNKGKNPQDNRGFPNQNKQGDIRPNATKPNQPVQDKFDSNKNPKKPR